MRGASRRGRHPGAGAQRRLRLFSYSLGAHEGVTVKTHMEALDLLRRYGFPVNPTTTAFDTIQEVIDYIHTWDEKRLDLDYDTDGMVIKVNDFEQRERMGYTSKAPRWVVDGNYGVVRELVWSRATHVVWLDYDRHVIMYRVVKRSMMRAIDRTELWAGNREIWWRWLRPSHPIRWAWSTWRRRRSELEELLGREEYKHLGVLHVRRPRDAPDVVDALCRGQRRNQRNT